jgi:5-(carboxyamino)imidazole ribonucleotide mutase
MAPPAFVAIIVGSRSDLEVVQKAADTLGALGVTNELRVISAHRAPDCSTRTSATRQRGAKVFSALPASRAPAWRRCVQDDAAVIGLPMPGSLAGGLDALLSIVQMPKGVPVATVGVGQAENAALLAAQMLGLSDATVAKAIADHRAAARKQIEDDPTNR